jgi:hypothetical protein
MSIVKSLSADSESFRVSEDKNYKSSALDSSTLLKNYNKISNIAKYVSITLLAIAVITLTAFFCLVPFGTVSFISACVILGAFIGSYSGHLALEKVRDIYKKRIDDLINFPQLAKWFS